MLSGTGLTSFFSSTASSLPPFALGFAAGGFLSSFLAAFFAPAPPAWFADAASSRCFFESRGSEITCNSSSVSFSPFSYLAISSNFLRAFLDFSARPGSESSQLFLIAFSRSSLSVSRTIATVSVDITFKNQWRFSVTADTVFASGQSRRSKVASRR